MRQYRKAGPQDAPKAKAALLLPPTVSQAVSQVVSQPEPVSQPKRDRKEYMRELMRKKRAAAKA